jgi:hypothetical protein
MESFVIIYMSAQNTLKSFHHSSIQIQCISTWKFNEEHNYVSLQTLQVSYHAIFCREM